MNFFLIISIQFRLCYLCCIREFWNSINLLISLCRNTFFVLSFFFKRIFRRMVQNIIIASRVIYWRHLSFWCLSPVSSCFSISGICWIKRLIVIFKHFIDLGIDTWINYICLLMFSSLVYQVLNFDINILKLNLIKILKFWGHFTWTSF